ncbi:DNA polymerase IV [Slackia heliotrinireducens]|uniref:DNA polymerase IV n=1 Tax=Slackia heliotrinireducens TaxID=84110 RepID=UPI003315C2C6
MDAHEQISVFGFEGEWNGPAILLVDLDAFFASVEQLDHPAWRGKPVIVGGNADKHGVVSTASYEARVYGVHSAMPASQARSLCPHAICTPGHFDRYREMSRKVMAIIHDESPHVQQVSIDEAFVDVSPTRVNRESPVSVAQRIQSRVAKLGITCSIGVGTSKTIAKIASDMDKPRGLTVVFPGRELDFLSPLPVRAMSGVGSRAEEVLKAHGVETLGQMAKAPESLLHSIYGKNADMMRNRCLGLDATAVAQDDTVKSVSSETTMADDLVTFDDISAVAGSMAAKTCRRLRAKGLKGTTLALKIRFSDRSTRSVQQQLEEPSDNEHELIPLLDTMIGHLWKPGMKVRLIGVAVTGFDADDLVQDSLFDASEYDDAPPKPPSRHVMSKEQGEHLASATDLVKNRFGEGALVFGRDLKMRSNTTGTAAKNPEDYR